MLKGKGRFINRKPTVKGVEYYQLVLYIPKDVAKDSQFPFNQGEYALVEIQGKKLVVSKIQESTDHSDAQVQ